MTQKHSNTFLMVFKKTVDYGFFDAFHYFSPEKKRKKIKGKQKLIEEQRFSHTTDKTHGVVRDTGQ